MQNANTLARAPALEIIRVNLIVGRARARFSQEDLAERSGVGRATISRIERGAATDVGVDTLERLAGALGVSIAAFFVSPSAARADDDELDLRAADSDDEFIDARALLDAVSEAADGEERYSRAGRPPVSR